MTLFGFIIQYPTIETSPQVVRAKVSVSEEFHCLNAII